jgi:hypothetical protein
MRLYHFDFGKKEALQWIKSNSRPGKTLIMYWITLQALLVATGVASFYLKAILDSGDLEYNTLNTTAIWSLSMSPLLIMALVTWRYFLASKRTAAEAFQWGLMNSLPQYLLQLVMIPLGVQIVEGEFLPYLLAAQPTQFYGLISGWLLYSGLFLLFKLGWKRGALRVFAILSSSFILVAVFFTIVPTALARPMDSVSALALASDFGLFAVPSALYSALIYAMMVPSYLAISGRIRLPAQQRLVYFFGILIGLKAVLSLANIASLQLCLMYLPTPPIMGIEQLPVASLWGLARDVVSLVVGFWMVAGYAGNIPKSE